MLPTLTTFLGFSEAEMRPYVEYKIPAEEYDRVGTRPVDIASPAPKSVSESDPISQNSSDVSVPSTDTFAECV